MPRTFVVPLIAVFAQPTFSQTLPPVTSGQLVAQFQAEPGTVATDAQGVVQSWTALNDPSIVLNTMGSPGPQIVFLPTAMNGSGTIAFSDPPSEPNTWLQGVFPSHVDMTAATVFWLGHYETNSANYGRYCYSIGTSAGSGSTQLTHQSDDTPGGGYRLEIYTGDVTLLGGSISQIENDYVVWRTEYYSGNPASNYRAFGDGMSLSGAATSIGYDVGPHPHPVFLGGFEDDGFNFVGRVAEFLIYQGVLDSTDVAAVEAYLSARRGNPIYTRYCVATPNSFGCPARIHAAGSTSLASNNLLLSAQPVPINVVGIFYYGATEIQAPFGNGNRCVGGSTSRLQPPAPASLYAFLRPVDNTNLPAGGSIVAGDTVKFQAWFRDPGGGGSAFNLSDGLSITFTP